MGKRLEQKDLNEIFHPPKLTTSELSGGGAGVTAGFVMAFDPSTGGFKLAAPGGIGTPGAPDDASYLVLSSNANLSAERVVNEGFGLDITDGGTTAGATFDVIINGGDAIAATSGLGSAGITVDLFISGQNTGDVIYRSSTNWTRLPAGTNGQILQTRGVGLAPRWITAGVNSLPSATTIGQVLYSTDGANFTAETPVTSEDGWLVNDNGVLIVEGS